MSLTQMDDLIAYLQKLPQDSDPGLTDNSISLGVVVSAPAARSLVEAYISRLNQAGGIFGRKIDLRFTSALTQTFIDTEHPLAIAASSLIGNEDEFESVIDRNQLPSIAAIATREPKSRYSFHVLAGIREQAVALAQYAAKRGAQHPSIVFADEPPWREIAAEVVQETKIEQPASPDALIVLGPESMQREILRKASVADHPPLVLIPGAIAVDIDDLPQTLDDRAAIAVPYFYSDASPTGLAELHALGAKSTSPSITGSLIAVQLLVEALRRIGRDVGREKLIDSLEGFYNMDTAVTPTITFGPNRHTGTSVAHILVWSAKEKGFVRMMLHTRSNSRSDDSASQVPAQAFENRPSHSTVLHICSTGNSARKSSRPRYALNIGCT
jgi:ABC-type branched-subunit amino acid transport system substrate-binding protein